MTTSNDFSLDPTTTAFVFIEYQNEFTTQGGKFHDAVKDCMERTNSTLLLFRLIDSFVLNSRENVEFSLGCFSFGQHAIM